MCVDWGYLAASVPRQLGQSEDRGVIVPLKPVKAGGGKGARESELVELPRLKLPVASASNGYADGRSRSSGSAEEKKPHNVVDL